MHWVVYGIPVSGNCIHKSVAPPSGVRELLTGVRGVPGVFEKRTRGNSTKIGSYTTQHFSYTSRWRHRLVYGIPVSGNCIHHSVPDSAGVNILLVFFARFCSDLIVWNMSRIWTRKWMNIKSRRSPGYPLLVDLENKSPYIPPPEELLLRNWHFCSSPIRRFKSRIISSNSNNSSISSEL